jgi:hypothetical protein
MIHFVYFFSFGALYFGQTFCIYMGCTDIDIVYMTFVVYGWFWFSFMVMCLWLCVWMYVYGCMFGYVFGVCVWVCVWGMCLGVYGYRVSILREAWFNKYRGLPLLGARFHHHWDLLASRGPFQQILGLTPSRGPFLSMSGLTPSRGPFHHHRVLLLHEAHFSKSRVLLFHEAHLDDFPNFSNFS